MNTNLGFSSIKLVVLQIFGSQFSIFFSNRHTKTNVIKLIKFIVVLVGIFVLYAAIFQVIAHYEGAEYSWVSAFYWVLVTMSTLGFGDIVFTTDIGKLFSMSVVFTGIIFLLVLLPFTFIEFFYAPWMKAQSQARAPKTLGKKKKNHVIITQLNAVTDALIKKLVANKIDYVILEPDLQKTIELTELNYNVLNLDPTDFETYKNVNIEEAAMVVASNSDMINTNVAFTAREFNEEIKIVATAASQDSVDILQMAGANNVLKTGEILGRSLARRTLGGNARVHVIGHIDQLVIGEATVQETPLVGLTLKESNIRENVGVSVVGIWERGRFIQPMPDTKIHEETVLVLAGSVDQLRRYDELVSIYHVSDKPVIIVGAGRVGRAAAKNLDERSVDYRIIDKDIDRIKEGGKYIHGDAADYSVLKDAGLDEAHTVLVTTNNDDINIYLTIYCRQLNPNIQIISRATYEKNINTLHRAGADFVMSYASMGANSIFNIIESKSILMLAEGLNVFDHKVNYHLANKSLIESDIRKETGCTVIAINCKSGKMLINPPPDRTLKEGDEIVLIGTSESENDFNTRYELADK